MRATQEAAGSEYRLEKEVWTEVDFDQMGWHDSEIHAIAFLPDIFEFVLDIDYIFAWVHPVDDDEYFKFWVAPCTAVFGNCHDLRLDVSSSGGLTVQDIGRSEPISPRNAEYIGRDKEWRWTIDCNEGEISFSAAFLKQYVRKAPRLVRQQRLTADRGTPFLREFER